MTNLKTMKTTKILLTITVLLTIILSSILFSAYASNYNEPDSPTSQAYFPDGMCWKYLVSENSRDTFCVIIENHDAVCYLNNDSVMSIELLQYNDEIMAYLVENNTFPTIYMFSDNYISIADFYAKDRSPQYVHPTRVTPIVLLDGRTAAVWAYDGNRPSDIEYIGSEKGILYPILDYIPFITSESRFLQCSVGEQLVYEPQLLNSSITEILLENRMEKIIEEGQLIIINNNTRFNILGARVQ